MQNNNNNSILFQNTLNQINQNKFSQEDINKINYLINIKDINKETQSISIIRQWITSKQFIYLIRLSNSINTRIIKKLILYSNKIDDLGIKYFCDQQNKWDQLKELNLFKNCISIKGVLSLSKAAEMKFFPNLIYLDLGENKIGSNDFKDKQLLKQQEQGLILKFANENTKLEELYLYENNINDDDIKILFKANSKDKKIFHCLNKLCLGDNKIKTVQTLIQQKVQYPSLKKIYLYQNQINKTGIKCLVSQKAKNAFKNIQDLSLSNNIMIRDEGICEFIKGCHLGAFPLLLELSINNIGLSNYGIQYLIKLYNPSKSLKFLIQLKAEDNILQTNLSLIKNNLKNRFKSQFSYKI